MKKLTQKFGLYAVATLAFIAVLFLNIEKNEKGDWTVGVPSSFARTGGENGDGGSNWTRVDKDCKYLFEGAANADVYLFGIKVGTADVNGEFRYTYEGGKTHCIEGGNEQCEARYCPPLQFSNHP